METRLRRAITQALRARTKSSPTASKTFGLRPNGNPPTAGNNTGASRPDKKLAYGEQNVRPSAELKPAYGGQYHRRFAPDYGRFAPGQRARLRRAKRSAFGRIETRLRRADNPTLSLWTNQKVRKTGFAPKERPKAENRNSVRTFILQVT